MLPNSIDMESTNTKVHIFSEFKNTFSPNAKPWAQWTP